jgi:uncharacterized SAM-binding protein YcdF (DUF218 family)
MNELLLNVGLAQWKPLLGVLLLPPVPMLLLVLLGTRLLFTRRGLGWLLVLLGVVGIWLSCTTALSRALTLGVLKPPPALTEAAVQALARQPRTAVVVLGGGRRFSAPEYGSVTLNARSMERLRYGIWLGRETSLPLLFSGGSGRSESNGPAEAELAARIAEREYKMPLRWVEAQSRDTHENAMRSVPLLKSQGIERIVLVTHAYHMPRALRNFQRAQTLYSPSAALELVAAPLGRPLPGPWKPTDWLPSLRGFEETYLALHELLGLAGGA